MREIKFRAWQKKPSLHRKCGMYLVDDIVFHDQGGGGEVFLHLPGEDSKSSEYFDDVHLMQYTGLTDKNGVEIYEGDVVKGFITKGIVVRRTSVGEVRNGEVIISPHFGTCVRWQESKYRGIPSVEETEVIGNIYENPELLKTHA